MAAATIESFDPVEVHLLNSAVDQISRGDVMRLNELYPGTVYGLIDGKKKVFPVLSKYAHFVKGSIMIDEKTLEDAKKSSSNLLKQKDDEIRSNLHMDFER